MNEYSERLRTAVEYLIEKGKAKTRTEIGRRVGLKPSTFSMILSGKRGPGIDLFRAFVREYPINLYWLVTGEGDMNRDTISRLRRQVAELKKKLEFTLCEGSACEFIEK